MVDNCFNATANNAIAPVMKRSAVDKPANLAIPAILPVLERAFDRRPMATVRPVIIAAITANAPTEAHNLLGSILEIKNKAPANIRIAIAAFLIASDAVCHCLAFK